MNIYLDINGVLLNNDLTPAKGVTSFLKYVTENHTVYWLTTHCKGGENNAVWYLERILPVEAHQYLDKILPTNWSTWKTEAIDFSQDFRWMDDNVFKTELEVLAKHDCVDKLIKINLQGTFNLVWLLNKKIVNIRS